MTIRTSRIAAIAALGVALPLAASAQTALSTQLANDGTHAADLHWINFDGVAMADLAVNTAYTAAVSNGADPGFTLSFSLGDTDGNFEPRIVSIGTGLFGRTGNYSQSGSVALEIIGARGLSDTLDFTSIAVLNNAGQRMQFQWVIADAERTNVASVVGNPDEEIDGVTNGANWAELEMLTNGGAPNSTLTLTGNTFSITGTSGGSYNAYLVSSKNPDAISVTATTSSTSSTAIEATAFAVQPLLPQVSVACVQPRIATGQTSVCTVTVTNPLLDNFTIPVTVPASANYTTTCGTLNFAGSASASVSQTCTVTATSSSASTVPVTVTPAPGIYAIQQDGQVLINQTAATAAAVPTLGEMAMALLAMLLAGGAALGLRRKG